MEDEGEGDGTEGGREKKRLSVAWGAELVVVEAWEGRERKGGQETALPDDAKKKELSLLFFCFWQPLRPKKLRSRSGMNMILFIFALGFCVKEMVL